MDQYDHNLIIIFIQELAEDGKGGAAFHDGKVRLKKENGKPKELFFASDANALIEHTREVLVLEDNEVAHVKVCHLFLYKYIIEILFSFEILSKAKGTAF